MSDTGFFICLGITAACAVIAPLGIRKALHRETTHRLVWSALPAFAAAVGFACSLPFQYTQELPFLPLIAGGYFAGILATVLVYAAATIVNMRAPSRDAGLAATGQ